MMKYMKQRAIFGGDDTGATKPSGGRRLRRDLAGPRRVNIYR